MNLCACSKFWVVVPRTSTKAHCYAIDAAPVACTACTTQWPVQMSNSCQEELASCWKIGTAQFISVRLSSLPSPPCSSQGSSQFPDPEGPDPARPDAVEAVEGCSAFSWAWSFWGRRTWRFWSILGRATSKERAETTPGKDLPELLRSSKTWRVVSSHRWRSLWVFFVVAVLPMVNVWSRWSQCKLRSRRQMLRIVPTTSRSLSLKYVMICVDTSWSIVFYCMLLWYIVIICYFTIMPSHAEQCPWSGSDKFKWDRQKHDMTCSLFKTQRPKGMRSVYSICADLCLVAPLLTRSTVCWPLKMASVLFSTARNSLGA